MYKIKSLSVYKRCNDYTDKKFFPRDFPVITFSVITLLCTTDEFAVREEVENVNAFIFSVDANMN